MGASHNLEAFSKSMAARPLEFQPGTSYRYGYSIDILGRYIEAVAGKGLDEVMRERIFVPLEMNDTDFWIRRKDESSRMAVTYTRRNGSLRPGMGVGEALQKPPRMMGGQGLYGTTMDYARFCQMIARKGELGGKRILKASTVELMCQTTSKTFAAPMASEEWWMAKGCISGVEQPEQSSGFTPPQTATQCS